MFRKTQNESLGTQNGSHSLFFMHGSKNFGSSNQEIEEAESINNSKEKIEF